LAMVASRFPSTLIVQSFSIQSSSSWPMFLYRSCPTQCASSA
jgi:hypothetical protein